MGELVLLIKILFIPAGYLGAVCFAYWYKDHVSR